MNKKEIEAVYRNIHQTQTNSNKSTTMKQNPSSKRSFNDIIKSFVYYKLIIVEQK
jgi:hypothetical protein